MNKLLVFHKPMVRPKYIRKSSRMHYLGFVNLAAYLALHAPNWDVRVERDASKILNLHPDAVGISAVTEMWPRVTALVSRLRAGGFTGRIILGGPHVTMLPESMPRDATCTCVGWGEETLAELLSGAEISRVKGVAYWRGDEIVRTPPREAPDVDALPVNVRFEPKMQFHIKTVWGCPHRCRHCVESVILGKTRWLSAEWLLEIISARIAATGNRRFFFHNSSFITPPGRLERLHELMRKKNLLRKIKIDAVSLTASEVTESTMPMLRDIGAAKLGMGTESLNPRMLKIIKRGSVTLEHMERTMLWAKKAGLSPIGGAPVFGYPGETADDIRDCARRLRDYERRGLYRHWGCYVCQPLPGSELWRRMLAKGRVSPRMDFSRLRTDANESLFKSKWFYCNDAVVPRAEFVRVLRETGLAKFRG